MKMEVSLSPAGFQKESSVETDSRCTEDTLLNSRSTINSVCNDNCYNVCKRKTNFKSFFYIFGGAFFTFLGIASIVWTPFEILMHERIKMRPSLPPFQWWKYPPDEVLLKMYVFNITNTEEFLNSNDKQLNLQEIGPLIFQEKLTHTDTIFNDNGTLSYTSTRVPIYLPLFNNVDLEEEIYVANIAVLGMTSYMSDKSYFMKLGLRLMNNNVGNRPFTKISINDYLWNYTDPLLERAYQLFPMMVPMTNMGILSNIYNDFSDRITVTIGGKYDESKFFAIDQFRGSQFLPNMPNSCKDSVVNASEGVLYPQRLTKDIPLNYYRKTMCRVTPLHYNRERYKYGINGYMYVLPNNTYDRTTPSDNDCYKGSSSLPNGLSDVSACQFGMPIATSFPHFLYGDETIDDFVNGLNASGDRHTSYALVEPLTGIPMEGKARSQSNLVVGDLSFFGPTLNKFSKTVIPMFWAEYHQVGLPGYVLALLYFQVKILPIAQWFFTAFYFSMAAYFIFKFIYAERKIGLNLIQNAQLRFETESFLKKKTFSKV